MVNDPRNPKPPDRPHIPGQWIRIPDHRPAEPGREPGKEDKGPTISPQKVLPPPPPRPPKK